jgi:hypothetical protein
MWEFAWFLGLFVGQSGGMGSSDRTHASLKQGNHVKSGAFWLFEGAA